MHGLKITACSPKANEADDEGVPEDCKTLSLLKHLAWTKVHNQNQYV